MYVAQSSLDSSPNANACGIISNMPLQKYFCTGCTLRRVERLDATLGATLSTRLDLTWLAQMSG